MGIRRCFGSLVLILSFTILAISIAFGGCSHPKTINDTVVELAAKGDPNAEFKLGLMYAFGDGVAHDIEEAKRLIRKSADSGYPAAQLSVGLEDVGLIMELGAFTSWVFSQTELAGPWVRGELKSHEHDEAIAYIKKAADGGNIHAQFLLGELFWVQSNQPEARRYLNLAAQTGHPNAQFTLGKLESDAKNDAECVKWFHRAAVQGLTEAQFRLGRDYARGSKVLQDYVEAYKWLNIAAGNQKSILAKDILAARDEVVGKMTPQQVAEGQKRSAEFAPKKESK
jgi:uncharacterized protein